MTKHDFFAVFTAIVGIIVSVYVGIWLLLIKGIANLIVAISAGTTDSSKVALDVLMTISGAPVTVILLIAFSMLSAAVLEEGKGYD